VLAYLLTATLVSLTASSVLGVRLLRLARRTGELPELLMGASFLVAGVVGYALTIAGRPDAGAVPQDLAAICFGAGYACISAGVVLTYVFNWMVFHRHSPVAASATAGASLLVAATFFPMVHSRIAHAPQDAVDWVGNLARMGSGAWGGWVAFAHFRRLRRRVALDLADPALANRFLLWALTMAATFAIFLATSLPVGSQTSRMSETHIALISTLMLVAALAQWLAFFPPRGYLRWIRGATVANA